MKYCMEAFGDFLGIDYLKICFNCQSSHDLWWLAYLIFCSRKQMQVSFLVLDFFFFLHATVSLPTLETYFKRYDFFNIWVFKGIWPLFDHPIHIQFLQAWFCCLSLAWCPLQKASALMNTAPRKLLESPAYLHPPSLY